MWDSELSEHLHGIRKRPGKSDASIASPDYLHHVGLEDHVHAFMTEYLPQNTKVSEKDKAVEKMAHLVYDVAWSVCS